MSDQAKVFSYKQFRYLKGGLYADAAELFTAEAEEEAAECDLAPLTKLIGIRGKTGAVVYYELVATPRDREGDTVSWRYIPTQESKYNVPKCKGTWVTVHND